MTKSQILIQRAKNALIVGMGFMIVGYFAPHFYYLYLDSTVNYYYAEVRDGKLVRTDELDTDKEVYMPCEAVLLSGLRVSTFDGQIEAVKQLILFKDIEGQQVKVRVQTVKTDGATTVQPSGDLIAVEAQLPCDLKTGIYYYQGVVEYHLRDVPKSYSWTTNNFGVIANK